MYDEVSDTPTLARNSDLNDDLGQMTTFFSDKTSTFTPNEVDFCKMSIHGVSYGHGTSVIGREVTRRLGIDISASDMLADNTPTLVKTNHGNFLDPAGDFEHDSEARMHPKQAARIYDFLVHLAVSHSVVYETLSGNSSGTGFSVSSPDELALECLFQAQPDGQVLISVPTQCDRMVYERLQMIDFTNTRKRLSVVVQTPEKRIMLLTKGALSVIFPCLLQSTPIRG
ncbi:hypothetical protein PsorP6_002489 [Peronosclerospora sorghi]|uniref:Uncharacterized protein n=1 Tax=Peronosclerospora sorghi TaxID=230839 RepID=A0ACC0WZ09_9STRA|nr:hypothetical protein PsorP6_002489 [Peronosclerospora sorghi]